MLSIEEKKFLLGIARGVLNDYFSKNDDKNPGLNLKCGKEFLYSIDKDKLTDALKEKRGCFVTLTINGTLRGCIGYIEPIKELYKAVIDNAINAAIHDPRFPPLSRDELDRVNIEISVLTVPRILDYKSTGELIEKLNPKRDGVIIKKDGYEATYLPQVWNELRSKEEFLSTLCLKAGLNVDCWKQHPKVYVYQAEYFDEKSIK